MANALELGCGLYFRNPFKVPEDQLFGVDSREGMGVNVRIADLAIEPIPFESESFDYVSAHDFLEHIPRLLYAPHQRYPFVELMNEIYRVLKPGGLFYSATPAYPHPQAFQDPTHVNILTEQTFPYYFDNKNRWAKEYGFTGSFEIQKQEWNSIHLVTILKKVAL